MGRTSGLDLRRKNELGRDPLAKGGRDRGTAAETALRAAVLAPGRRDEGRNGRGRWLWTPPALRRENRGKPRFGGSSGPAGIAGSRRVLPGLPEFFF
ncbi:hypothetical protein CRG98_000649 [Punica granatum]|uniref:Uncharacterized protein n=1 Tax=Punica granatum TaxID=22663 RepID=A0A2I0LEA6_PUNGR|nr:hypothetical protein CRG98_000649 [Punica granatum]